MKTYKNITKVIAFIFLLLTPLAVQAQASYGDRSFGEGNFKYSISTENDSIYLKLIIVSWKFKFSESPKMLIRIMDDSVISLEGYLIGSSEKDSGSVIVGNVAVASNEYVSEAKFPVSKTQIELFSKGIKKIRLNTSPDFHEKEWIRDKIGKKLYQQYKNSSGNSFEDNF